MFLPALLCALGLSKGLAPAVGLGARAGGPGSACCCEPSAPAASQAELAAQKQRLLSLAWLCLGRGRGVLMSVLCSHTTLVK